MKRIVIFFIVGKVLLANPTGPVVISGEVAFQEDLRITATDQSVIHWDAFSIGAGERTEFFLPDSSSVVLNRVVGQNLSAIHGQLISNGQVILINPNGVLFGKESRIDVAHLMASTCDIQSEFFKANHFRNYEYGSTGKIEVSGWIAANEISLAASTIELQDGCHLAASSDNGGGIINICGKVLHIQPQAKISADALIRGDGGNILFWGDEQALHYGLTTAQGGPLGGKGGFVEISGAYLDFSGTVKAPNGTLLLDPTDVTIQAGGAASVCIANTPPVNTIFDNVILGTVLDGCSVTILTSGGATGNGDITVLDPVTWTLGTSTFSLIADRHIFVFDSISTTSAGVSPINLTALTGNITIDAATAVTSVAVQTINGDISLSAPLGSISILGGVNPSNFAAVGQSASPAITSSGNINVDAGVDLLIQGGSAFRAIAYIGRIGIVAAIAGAAIIGGDINICVGDTFRIYGGTGLRADAFVGQGNISFIVPCFVTSLTDFNINVGHTLDMMSGSTSGASFIGGGSSIDIQGDMRINVGEYAYLHNHPTNNPNMAFPWATFIGYVFNGMSFCPMAVSPHQNLYLNVGRNLTLDSRNPANTGGEVFIHVENAIADLTTQSIQRIHVGGDINCIAGTRKAVIEGLASPAPVNEVLVEGSIRCYNGYNPNAPPNAPAFVIASPTIAFGQLGLLTIRACGNIIQAGGIEFTDNLFSSFPMFFEADAAFTIGELWPPLSCIINGSNIFAGTPLSVNSGNASTVDPLNVGGNGLGGFAIDTAFYNCGPPSTFMGFLPILSPAAGLPCAPTIPASSTVTYFGFEDITLLSSDRFVDGNPTDLGIGFQTNDIMFFTFGSVGFPADITIAGFRNINIHEGPQSDTAGSILIIAQNDITVGPNVFDGPNIFGGPNSLSAADNLTLVVDNQAPIRPLIGGVWRALGGRITVDAAAQLVSGANAGGGLLRIYTARQSLNSILGTLNGFSFAAGTLFVETLLERWCLYYPEFIPGVPFTISYKECRPIIANQATIIIDEFLEDLADEFPGWAAIFWQRGDIDDYRISEPYFLRRRQLRIFNHPKTWSQLTGGDWAPLTTSEPYFWTGIKSKEKPDYSKFGSISLEESKEEIILKNKRKKR